MQAWKFQIFKGILSRENKIHDLPLLTGTGEKLQILVENQGRINYNILNDFKGILSDVKLDGRPLHNWTITGFPMENYTAIQNFIDSQINESIKELPNRAYIKTGPTFFHGTFNLNSTIYDTYLDPTGWGKVCFFGSKSNISFKLINMFFVIGNRIYKRI